LRADVAEQHGPDTGVTVKRLGNRQRQENPVGNRNEKDECVPLCLAAEHRRQQQSYKIRYHDQQAARHRADPAVAQRWGIHRSQHLREHKRRKGDIHHQPAQGGREILRQKSAPPRQPAADDDKEHRRDFEKDHMNHYANPTKSLEFCQNVG
jgi:hypothetical protein